MNRLARLKGYSRPPITGHPAHSWLGFILLVVVVLRSLLFYRNQSVLPAVILLLAGFSLLWFLEPMLHARFSRFPLLYFPLQTGILVALSRQQPFLDFVQILYIAISLQALRNVTFRQASAWLALFAISVSVSLVLATGWLQGLAFSLVLMSGCAFLISYQSLTVRMQSDRDKSQRMLVELQHAHQKLKDHADRAEELAKVRERNRLARELHDSVSQSIFAIRLTSQSARLLLVRNPARVPEMLGSLQKMSQETLEQLRSLIAQLRPPSQD